MSDHQLVCHPHCCRARFLDRPRASAHHTAAETCPIRPTGKPSRRNSSVIVRPMRHRGSGDHDTLKDFCAILCHLGPRGKPRKRRKWLRLHRRIGSANGNRIRQHGCSGRSGNAAAPDPQARGTELPEDILPSFYVTESAHKCAPSAHVSHLRGNKGLWQSTNWTENTTT
jgi:hypothetical protein